MGERGGGGAPVAVDDMRTSPRVKSNIHSDICDQAKPTSLQAQKLRSWAHLARQTKPHCWQSDPAGCLVKPSSAIESFKLNCYLGASTVKYFEFFIFLALICPAERADRTEVLSYYPRQTHPDLR